MSVSEKGPLAFLITGTTVAAFAASNLYVFGLSIALHHDLASHFEILDWVRITPAWALPAALFYGLVFGCTLLWGLFPGKRSMAQIIVRILVGTALFGALLYGRDVMVMYAGGLWEAIVGTFFISLYIGIVGRWALKKVTANQQTFMRTILGQKFVETSVAWLSVLSFAFFFGLFVAPILLRNKSTTRIVLAEEKPNPEGAIGPTGLKGNLNLTPKEAEVKGKLIFRLSHSVLLLTKGHGSPLVVIPEEKIQRIESLKVQYPRWERRSAATPKPTP